MNELERVNNELGELDSQFWELVHRGDYATADGQSLAERVAQLRVRRRALLAADRVEAHSTTDDNPPDGGPTTEDQ